VTAAEDALGRIAAGAPVRLKGVGAPEGADGARASGPVEPVFDEARRRDIQGNIVPGFNKDHQHFLFLRIRRPDQARRWVARIAPSITSMDEALTFVREHRARRHTEGVREPEGLRATWVTIAFSHAGIAKLAGAAEAARFGEQSFRDGLAARSTHLGDPTSPEHPGHRDHWLVGGPGNEADVLVVVAADDAADWPRRSRRSRPDPGCSTSCSSRRRTRCPATSPATSTSGSRTACPSPGCAAGSPRPRTTSSPRATS
jgi:hypothetical protein